MALTAVACGGATEAEESVGDSQDEIRVTSSFTSRGTGYYPSSSALEGGFNDRKGKKLRTLQQFLAGSAEYVSVAMDSNAFKYGTRLRIKELDAKYGRKIIFRVVDTGGAFRGRGRTRIDVCVANRTASVDRTINGTLHIEVIDETSGPAEDPTPDNENGSGQAGNTDPVDPDPGTNAGTGSGRSCSNDGACNPGNDGSGEICTAGKCVAGCRSKAQCPGSKSCVSGQCQ
jgi:3D (Asp-Asp-Asp) domain-containing protein